MRLSVLLAAVLSTAAFADVGPRPPPCKVPKGCVTCTADLREESSGAECRGQALDAGLVQSDCSDRSGPVMSQYYCPAESPAKRFSCASIDVLGLGAVVLLLRRTRRR